MLTSISITDIVLIERLELEFGAGLCVLTGETGAGKSILLDAMSLALGARGDAGLVRNGVAQGTVSVTFTVPKEHAINQTLNDLALSLDQAHLVLRRVLGRDGRSRAFINDQAVSVSALREVGEQLVEIHGQHDAHGLLRPKTHRRVLDQYGGLVDLNRQCNDHHGQWRQLSERLKVLGIASDKAKMEEDYLRHSLGELEQLALREGEEAELLELRALLKEGQRITDHMAEALGLLRDGDGPEARVLSALKLLRRIGDKAAGKLDNAIDLLDHAGEALALAHDGLETVRRELNLAPSRLEEVEDRLFALRDVARKHRVGIEQLFGLRDEIERRLSNLDDGEAEIVRLTLEQTQTQMAYEDCVGKLSQKRRTAAAKLTRAVIRELPALAMDKAIFEVELEPLERTDWGPNGGERVRFKIATNLGVKPGPLNKIASGGELSRFMLALKVALQSRNNTLTMIFDEVDAGVGGATAAKVGERLARLSQGGQVLVVTHSPQVAARGKNHYRIEKREENKQSITDIAQLGAAARLEEVARMLAGAEITAEARAAAGRLLEAGS